MFTYLFKKKSDMISLVAEVGNLNLFVSTSILFHLIHYLEIELALDILVLQSLINIKCKRNSIIINSNVTPCQN
jgi:hypothetical protein